MFFFTLFFSDSLDLIIYFCVEDFQLGGLGACEDPHLDTTRIGKDAGFRCHQDRQGRRVRYHQDKQSLDTTRQGTVEVQLWS